MKAMSMVEVGRGKAGLEFLDAAPPLSKNFGSLSVTGQGSGCSFLVRNVLLTDTHYLLPVFLNNWQYIEG